MTTAQADRRIDADRQIDVIKGMKLLGEHGINPGATRSHLIGHGGDIVCEVKADRTVSEAEILLYLGY